jgi:hypothetical protein
MRLGWRERVSRDIKAISDYCLHVSAVRVPDADGFFRPLAATAGCRRP